jgi:uncharacterized alpha-E superfamily protein
MISRVAESCFWVNRYVERVESLARLLDVNAAFILDVELAAAERWRPLVIVTGEQASFNRTIGAESGEDGEIVQEYLTWNGENPSSIVSSLRGARENVRTTRETVSLEVWETLNDLWLWITSRAARTLYKRDRHAFYAHLRDRCLLFHGVCHNTMLHEEAFVFMRLGTALERAGQTARIVDVKYHSIGPTRADAELPAEAAEWLAILRSCAGVEAFFKRSTNVLGGQSIASFLLFDPAFPRSIRHNTARAGNFLRLIRPSEPPEVGRRSAALLGAFRRELDELDIDAVMARGIHDTMTWVVNTVADICTGVHEDYFDPPIEATGAQWQTMGAAGGPSE